MGSGRETGGNKYFDYNQIEKLRDTPSTSQFKKELREHYNKKDYQKKLKHYLFVIGIILFLVVIIFIYYYSRYLR